MERKRAMANTEVFRRRHLPHWDMPGATYFVTACLHGSIPAQGLLDIQAYKTELARHPRPCDIAETDWAIRQWKLEFVRLEQWLDQTPAVRYLAKAELAAAVVKSLLYFAGSRLEVFAFVVMPSHIHWIFRPLDAWASHLAAEAPERTARETIMHSIKRFTASECNKMLGTSGIFWQPESYDHWVRDPDELERIINYVEYNPVKAGLCADAKDWPFSSARLREEKKSPFGAALPVGCFPT